MENIFSPSILPMNTPINESEAAELLVTMATDLASVYLSEDDFDAGIVALLACALEIASGKKLVPLEYIFRKNHGLQ